MRARVHTSITGREGLTLIELLVALALICLLVSGVSVSLSGWTSAQLRSAARKVMSAFRYAYVTSMTQGKVLRVTFNMKDSTLSIEASKEQVLIAKNAGENASQSAAQNPWEVAKKRLSQPYAELKEWSDPFAPVSPTGGKAAPVPLGGSIHIVKVQTSAHPDSTNQEKESVYFFQNGINEHAVVQIGDDNGRTYSVEVMPMTGRTKFYNHAYEATDMKNEAFMEARQ